MSSFERRNVYFDRLFATKNLYWLGQNTNHLPMHAAVRQAILASIEAEEFHAYAPPGGFTTLVRGIIDDVGLRPRSRPQHLEPASLHSVRLRPA
jgi:histidinol-phosphate aminotransferase